MDNIQAAMLENRTFEEIAVGETAGSVRTLTLDDIALFAIVSGDLNPMHLDRAYAATDMFHHVIAHGMWGGGLISAVLGTRLPGPGPGTIHLSQELRFLAPVAPGDTITTTVKAAWWSAAACRSSSPTGPTARAPASSPAPSVC